MKRFTAILLAFYFAIAAIGISYDMHYCMGMPVGIAVAEEDCCGIQAELDGCCETETIVYKIEDSFIANFTNVNLKVNVLELPKTNFTPVVLNSTFNYTKSMQPANAPPFEGPPRTILYCTYLI